MQSHNGITASSYMGKFFAFPHILGSPSSYMTLHPIPSEFPYIRGNFFYQCIGDHAGNVLHARAQLINCKAYIYLYLACFIIRIERKIVIVGAKKNHHAIALDGLFSYILVILYVVSKGRHYLCLFI